MSGDGLFQFGDYEIPSTCIAENGYDTSPNQRQDLDPYTDQYGYTQRNALQHSKTEVRITTRDNLSWDEMNAIINGITSNYRSWKERDADCVYWDNERLTYSSGHFYLESSQPFKIKTFKKRYPSITLTFVEY